MSLSFSEDERIRLDVENGKVLEIALPNCLEDRPCGFVLSVRKSGSTLLSKIIRQLAKANQVPVVSISNTAFEQNITFSEWKNCDSLNQIIRDGAVYIGFRALPDFLVENSLFKKRKKIFLVRDPRDAVVSQYFSTAYSHTIPKESKSNFGGPRESLLRNREIARNQPIDDFVLKHCESFNRTISSYIPLLRSDHIKIYRYEDVVLNKRTWIQEIANFLDFELSLSELDDILEMVDIVPSQENPEKFIRKVIPGDHTEKLNAETVEKLDHVFGKILDIFNYR